MDRALNLLRGVLAARRGIDPRQLDYDVDLDDLGLDYLDRVGLVMELEQLLGVRLADARLPELRYLSDLASWLAQEPAPASADCAMAEFKGYPLQRNPEEVARWQIVES